MDIGYKIIMIIGAAFMGIGGLVSFIFLAVGGIGVFAAIPLFFVLLGAIFLGAAIAGLNAKKKIVAKGRKYAAKIYSYVENTAFTVNGAYTVNVKVHFFDKDGIEKEAVIPTSFPKGSGEYPIGMTMDIYEYQGKYGFDPKSVRDEVLPGENELMDDKPVDRAKIKMVAVECPNCGSSFQAAAGYAAKCPYCGSSINA